MKQPDPYLRELTEKGFREHDAPRFLWVWEHLEAAYFAQIAAAVDGHQDWRERFRAAATETARLVEEHRAEARFVIVDALCAGDLGRERQRDLGARIAELIDSARAELVEPDAIPASTAQWIVGIFFDRVYRRCAGDGSGADLISQLPELMFLAISAYFGTEAGLEELVSPP